MADLVSEGGEFSCNFCTCNLKLSVINSSTTGDSKKLANQTNCFLPPPGGNCTFPPGAPPVPCTGVPLGCVVSTGQSIVKIDGQTALGDGCKFLCPKGQPVSLIKAGQTVAKHDEASSGVGAYIVGGCLVVGGVALAIALLPEEIGAAAVVGAGVAARAVGKIGLKAIKKVALKTKNAFKSKPKNKPPPKQPKGTRTKNRLPEGRGNDLGPKNDKLERRNPETGELQQTRWYDDKGKPKKDIDYGHDHNGSGDPHVHVWEYKNPQSPNPSRMDASPL